MITYKKCPGCYSDNINAVLDVKDFMVSKETFSIWHCNNCTLRFTQNIPAEDIIAAYYTSDNYISHSNTQKGLINKIYHIVRKHTLKVKRKYIAKISGKSSGELLDVGSGIGVFAAYMQSKEWLVTAIEPSAQARKASVEHYGIQALPIENLYTLNKKYDVITLWHVLEHIHDLHHIIEKLTNLLSPNGKIIIAVPNYTSLDATIYKSYWGAYDVPRHLYHFSPTAMHALSTQNNLIIEQIKPMWYDSFYISLLSEKYKNNGRTNFLKGFSNGLLSNIKALINPSRCSSITYTLKKLPIE